MDHPLEIGINIRHLVIYGILTLENLEAKLESAEPASNRSAEVCCMFVMSSLFIPQDDQTCRCWEMCCTDAQHMEEDTHTHATCCSFLALLSASSVNDVDGWPSKTYYVARDGFPHSWFFNYESLTTVCLFVCLMFYLAWLNYVELCWIVWQVSRELHKWMLSLNEAGDLVSSDHLFCLVSPWCPSLRENHGIAVRILLDKHVGD
jgi:hypothetical protein